jgi:hypothetical protein
LKSVHLVPSSQESHIFSELPQGRLSYFSPPVLYLVHHFQNLGGLTNT